MQQAEHNIGESREEVGTFEELKLITAWASPDPQALARCIANTILDSNNVVFYIDAASSFPLTPLQGLIPSDNKQAYENVRIQTSLNLDELNPTIKKVIQYLAMDKVRRRQESDRGPQSVLIVISGIEIMFRNSKSNSPTALHHTMLRDLLLKLRVEANHSDPRGVTLKSLILLPQTVYERSHSLNSTKRLKVAPIFGNSLSDYIVKFYADELVTRNL